MLISLLLACIFVLSAPSLVSCVPSSGSSVREDMIEIALGAQNKLVNDSLTMSVLDVQRRPVSIFQDAVQNNAIANASSNDVIIEVGMTVSFNRNTLSQLTGESANTLNDLLQLGSLMYIEGTDTDGGPYRSATVLTPTANNTVDSLSINNNWDYNLLNSQLPSTSESVNGSILFQVSSLAQDLNLIIITANGSSPALDAEAVMAGNHRMYILPLS